MTDALPKKRFTLHLVSDATGHTLQGLAYACLAQFDGIDPDQKFWPLIRTARQMERVCERIREQPGPVLYTLVDADLRQILQHFCHEHNVPCMPVMDPVIKGLSSYLGMTPKGVPGLQYTLDEAYFQRIEALDFALSFDDGQNFTGIEEADVILVGVSRTSKTPTCIFLARRGIRAANIPLVPGVTHPDHVFRYEGPLYVGLTERASHLANIRRSRLKADPNDPNYKANDYLDTDCIEDEIRKARRLFAKHGWPVIDVTKRSVEETAAEVLSLLQTNKDKKIGFGE
ncbi:MAG: kinase/pyrophosphorylase [Alphaproteobacteria bacterium]|nr:kinase/pyrophosphorylase [Alphaproteobacteria bacterium]